MRPAPRADLLPSIALVWAAALFGTSFVVVKAGLDQVDPIPYLALRFSLAGVVFALLARHRPSSPGERHLGMQAGVTYLIGMVCQTIGLQHLDASASAFLTYLLIVIVPIVVFVTSRRRPEPIVSVAIAVAVVGLALLTGGGAGFGLGTIVTLAGAVAFAVHLVQVGWAAERGFDLFRFNALQCLFVGLVLLPLLPFTGGLPSGPVGWGTVVYAALVVTVATFVPWMWAARRVPPTRAALILLTEPVFAAIAGIASGERPSPSAIAGASLILLGAVLAEAPGLRRGREGIAPADAGDLRVAGS